jgi:hypothetical protein
MTYFTDADGLEAVGGEAKPAGGDRRSSSS